ncbi:MAG TPA: DUF4834 family protein [Puia sp.]|nr:DUF4834 family protein [Puia sp.]
MMPLSEILFLVFVLVVLYRFFFNFLLPVVRTTRQVRQQFRNMQDAASNFNPNGPQGFQQQSQARPDGSQPRSDGSTQKKEQGPNSDKMGEYIDFEEVPTTKNQAN